MTTQKFTGKNSLVKRLTAQVKDKGLAIGLLKARGHMDEKGNLTKEGKKRNAMTASERAKDRAAKESGKKAEDYTYDVKTNRAKLK